MNDAANEVVLFEEIACANGTRIGIATLNSPKTLNALSYEMTLQLANRLEVWARDPDLAAVVLRGAGDRAFCAGGDLHSMYRSMTEYAPEVFGAESFPGQFFTHEYALD